MPVHKVTISRPFWISETEVTVEEFRKFKPEYKGSAYWAPFAGGVSWNDAVAYCKWLSEKEGKTYRLPTEAEWEYVARAGIGTVREPVRTRIDFPYPRAEDVHNTVPVGSFKPNAFGIYDLTGNIPEWVEDCYRDIYDGAPADGSAVESDRNGKADCLQRVVRGSYNFLGNENFHPFQRIANRDWNYASAGATGNPTGFRIARDMP